MTKKVLLIKLTSMGDLIHALPAITDAANAILGITFDWVVDEAFADVPSWHPSVGKVIKSAHRRWKKNIVHSVNNGELTHFYRELNASDYDVVIDSQNNIKSATIAWLRRGHCHGLDKLSVREKPAHWLYHYRHHISKNQHSITRQRQLFAKALNYPIPENLPSHGIDRSRMLPPSDIQLPQHYVVFVHNASWTTKLYPQQHWLQLIEKAGEAGLHVLLPCGNQQEQLRAEELAKNYKHAIALPKLSLSHIAGIINQAAGAVCCDTGLAHIASMLDVPSVSLYGPTNHHLIGATGLNQFHCVADDQRFNCAPCYRKQCSFDGKHSAQAACMHAFSPDDVWNKLLVLMEKNNQS